MNAATPSYTVLKATMPSECQRKLADTIVELCKSKSGYNKYDWENIIVAALQPEINALSLANQILKGAALTGRDDYGICCPLCKFTPSLGHSEICGIGQALAAIEKVIK